MRSEKLLDDIAKQAEDVMNGRVSVENMAIFHCRSIPKRYAAEQAMEAEELAMKTQDQTRKAAFLREKERLTTGRRAAHFAMRTRKEQENGIRN